MKLKTLFVHKSKSQPLCLCRYQRYSEIEWNSKNADYLGTIGLVALTCNNYLNIIMSLNSLGGRGIRKVNNADYVLYNNGGSRILYLDQPIWEEVARLEPVLGPHCNR